MPAKQRPSKHQSKKSKTMQRMVSGPEKPVEATITAPAVETAAPVPVPAPAPRAAAPARQKVMTYPYFGGEMRRIAVLAVILLVVLFILSRVLS